jgi:uncharacterized protein (DUF1330 family)
MTTCKVIVEGTLGDKGTDSDEFKEYLKRAVANDKVYGGVELQYHTVKENLGQGAKPDFVVLLEYPSYEQAKKAFASDEYQEILPLRNIAFKEVKILMTS